MSRIRAYTVRVEVKQQTGLELEFDEVCATTSHARALAMVEHYRTTEPAPLSFKARILRVSPYLPNRHYPRKNWCDHAMLPIPAHLHEACLEEMRCAAGDA